MARLKTQRYDPEYAMRVFGEQPSEPIMAALRQDQVLSHHGLWRWIRSRIGLPN